MYDDERYADYAERCWADWISPPLCGNDDEEEEESHV